MQSWRWPLYVLLLLSLLMATPVIARPPSSLDYSPTLDVGPLADGREAYRERADPQRARDAYRLLKKYRQQNLSDSVAAWHFSLSCYFLAKRVLRDKEEKKRIYIEGRDHAEAGIREDSECGPCYLMAAINSALWGREVGIFRTIVGLPKVLRNLNRATELDPAFGGGAPHRIKASIMIAIPRILGGGKKKAKVAILKAIEVAPDELLNYEFLADLLADKFKKPNEALRVARTGLERPIPGPEYVESLDAIEGLERIVRKYGGGSVSGG